MRQGDGDPDMHALTGRNLAAAMSHQPTVLAPPAVCMMSLPASLAAGNLNIANVGGLDNDVSLWDSDSDMGSWDVPSSPTRTHGV